MAGLKTRYAHDAVIQDPVTNNDNILGRFITFTDSDFYGEAFPKSLYLEGFQLKDNFPDLSSLNPSFYLGFDPNKPYNQGLNKYFENCRLQATSHQKLPTIRLDKYESQGILLIPNDKEREEIKKAGYLRGFVCKILKLKKPGMEISNVISPRANSVTAQQSTQSSSSSSSSFLLSPAYLPPVFAGSGVGNSTSSLSGFTIPLPPALAGINSSTMATTTITTTNNNNGAPLTAESHYNQLKRDKETRHLSQLFHMRNLNNFVKSELIEESCQLYASKVMAGIGEGLNVLDLACGKGGDVNKWLKNSIGLSSYIGIDIAENSIREYVERLLKRDEKDRLKIIKLIVGNLNEDSLTSSLLLTHQWALTNQSYGRGDSLKSVWEKMIPLKEKDSFDIISCQFAMHYMFQSQETTHHLFHEISNHLIENGFFIATTVDCRVLLSYFMKAKFGEKKSTLPNFAQYQTIFENISNGHEKDGCNQIDGLRSITYEKNGIQYYGIQIWNEFDQLLLQIDFEEKELNKLFFPSSAMKKNDEIVNPEDSFGIQYLFSLRDNDQEAAVDSPEFIVPLDDAFESLLAEHDLSVYKIQNFHDYILEKFSQPLSKDRMNKMDVFNINGTISGAEWSIAKLYTVIILQKNTASNGDTLDMKTPKIVSVSDRPPPRLRNPPSSPPRFRPTTPTYEPQPIGALIDPSTSKLWTKYAFRLDSKDSKTDNPEMPMEVEENGVREGEEDNEDEEEESFEVLMQLTQEAMELAGGEEVWEKLNDEECDEWIEKARQLSKKRKERSQDESSQRKKPKWKEYPPHSPDHPPPNYLP